MSEDNKIEKTEQEPKAAELSEQDLDKVAGGWSGSDGDEAITIVKPTDSASPKLF
jgi:hypothetical protein